MTELEKIEYAKTFIDKLANGVDPVQDKVIPDDSVLNNVRISRCLFYVSDVLRQVIDNGGIIAAPAPLKKERKKKLSFLLTVEEAENFAFSEEPITATEIISKIDSIGVKEGRKRFPRKNLVNWMIMLGLLEYIEINGKKVARPTSDGEELGLVFKERSGIYGTYYATYYNLDAQHFIIDNIDAVIALDWREYKSRFNLEKCGKPWSREEDEELMEQYKSGASLNAIAERLQRTKNGVKIRLSKHGVNLDSIENALSMDSANGEAAVQNNKHKA